MKIGDLVRIKKEYQSYLVTGDNEVRARSIYPWKFEVGIVIDAAPYGSMPGKEVHVCFPSSREKQLLRDRLEIINETR